MSPESYVGLITSQHREAPRFCAWVRFLVSLVDPDFGEKVAAAYSLSCAEGRQLDTLGTLAGIARNVLGDGGALDDTLFRRLIRARIVRNHFGGQQGDLQQIWQNVFADDLGIETYDHQDMTMSVVLKGNRYTPEMMGLLLGGYIVPKPLGVGVVFSLTTDFPDVMLGSACALSFGGVCMIPSAER